MIITDKFIWMHIPKCGGTTTRDVIRHYWGDEIVFDSAAEWGIPHLSEVPQRFLIDKERDWLINFRKLPGMLNSKANHCIREGAFSKIKASDKYNIQEEIIKGYTLQNSFYENNASDSSLPLVIDVNLITADQVLNPFLYVFKTVPRQKLHVIRNEYYRSDICDFADDPSIKILIRELNREIIIPYIKVDTNDLMYKNNPSWAALESQFFNDNN